MLYRTALLVGLLVASTDASSLVKTSIKTQQPLMRLLGGLGGVDAGQVANVVCGISAANAGVMSLAPKKAGEMYGVASTKWTDFFAQWAGLIMFGQTLTAFLAIGGMGLNEALGWGFVPSCVFAIQDLLNDRMVGEMGMAASAKFMPPLINIVLTLALLGKLPFLDGDVAAKFTTVWMGLNGLAGYFATDAWIEAWGGKGLSVVEKGMGKLMGQCMTASAAYVGASVFMGKSALESFGVMMGLYALCSVDFMFISKTMESMGVEPAKAGFWAVIQAITAATIFL